MKSLSELNVLFVAKNTYTSQDLSLKLKDLGINVFNTQPQHAVGTLNDAHRYFHALVLGNGLNTLFLNHLSEIKDVRNLNLPLFTFVITPSYYINAFWRKNLNFIASELSKQELMHQFFKYVLGKALTHTSIQNSD